MRAVIIFLAISLLYGCSLDPVKSWERDVLARPQMQLAHPIDNAFDDLFTLVKKPLVAVNHLPEEVADAIKTKASQD